MWLLFEHDLLPATNGWKVSDTFSITNVVSRGVRTGSHVFLYLLEAFRDMGDGLYVQPGLNAELFTVTHFRAKTKTTNILVREVFFADSSALIAHSAEEIQRIVDAFATASSMFDLKINIKKDKYDVPPELYHANNHCSTRYEQTFRHNKHTHTYQKAATDQDSRHNH